MRETMTGTEANTGANTGQVLAKTLVLVGMPGSGKTAIGRALSARLGVEMKDSDAEIVESAQLSIAEIFDRFGEPFFRDREAKVIERLLDSPPCVLSTGGGAWLTPENRDMISARAAVLWLEADLELLWSRVRHKNTRPLLRSANPKQTLSDLLAARTPSYELAPMRVHVQSAWSIEQTTDAVAAELAQAGVIKEAK